jgi:hypothetical protein
LAIQHNINLKGKLANIIMYERDGKYYARTAPARVRQTKATRKSAGEFGEASRISAGLRLGLGNALDGAANTNKLRNRLLPALIQLGRTKKTPGQNIDIPGLVGHQFNADISINDRFKKKPLIEWRPDQITLTFPLIKPAKEISAPARTGSVVFEIAATSFPLSDPRQTAGTHITQFIIDHTAESIASRQIQIPFGVKPGELAVVMLSITYEVKNKLVQDTKWRPAGIIGCCLVNDAKKR